MHSHTGKGGSSIVQTGGMWRPEDSNVSVHNRHMNTRVRVERSHTHTLGCINQQTHKIHTLMQKPEKTTHIQVIFGK